MRSVLVCALSSRHPVRESVGTAPVGAGRGGDGAAAAAARAAPRPTTRTARKLRRARPLPPTGALERTLMEV